MTTTTHQQTTEQAPSLTVDQLDHHGTTSSDVYTAGFTTTDRDFVIRGILGKAARGGADAGEVLELCSRVAPDDDRGWFDAWRGLGERVLSIAEASRSRGHRVSASRAYLRAACYFGVAVNAVDGLGGDASELLPTFRRHQSAWDGFVATTAWPVERIDIPYEGTTMPGWFFRPDGSGARRRTLVVNNGSDGSRSGCFTQAGQPALERGYNVLMFDGPGQQSMLFERRIGFRPDWEKVLTPVADRLLARHDVDPDRLAVFGVSQAGYWVPRALAFEHRYAAAIADPGVVSLSRTWFSQLPAELAQMYRSGDRSGFDQVMGRAMTQDAELRRVWEFRSRPYGVQGFSAVLDEVARYDVTDVAGRITTPLYITDPDGEQFFPGQPADLAALVPGATIARFGQDEGASYHCQPLARELTEQRMFDWLDEQLAGR